MAARRLTIRDIAKMTDVSYATVSRALSGSPGISDGTRKRILDTCDEVGYTTNFMARSLAVRESKLIGFIVGSVDNPYMGQLACNAEIHARNNGYNLILCNSMNRDNQETEVFSLLMGRQVDGIIIVPANSNSFKALEKYYDKIPTVFVGENLKDSRESYVAVDNYHGTYMGTEYLISLGHRKIVYLGRRPASTTHQLRADGYISACAHHGIAPSIIDNHALSSSIEQGYALAKNLFSKRPLPFSAVFASTDTTALGVMKAADEAGISIPGDISLMGFDNIPYSKMPRIDLTTIEQPLSAMAATAVDMLIDKIRDPSAGYSHKVLSPTLIKRGTCREAACKSKGKTA